VHIDLATDTVLHLKRKVKSLDGVPVSAQKLVIGGRVMANNNDVLRDVEGVAAGCTVHVSVGFHGHPAPAGLGGWEGNFFAKATPCMVPQSTEGQVRCGVERRLG
jgi:hypothetical protein